MFIAFLTFFLLSEVLLPKISFASSSLKRTFARGTRCAKVSIPEDCPLLSCSSVSDDVWDAITVGLSLTGATIEPVPSVVLASLFFILLAFMHSCGFRFLLLTELLTLGFILSCYHVEHVCYVGAVLLGHNLIGVGLLESSPACVHTKVVVQIDTEVKKHILTNLWVKVIKNCLDGNLAALFYIIHILYCLKPESVAECLSVCRAEETHLVGNLQVVLVENNVVHCIVLTSSTSKLSRVLDTHEASTA